jgi:predicted Zn finger-like uncharacterized protein
VQWTLEELRRMDVQCERCKTEYEFDDALVSGRGTTVKCTNCGFQFKVKPGADAPSNERWTVRTVGGVELVFTTLRELQRAITQKQVGRNDTLSRGNGPPRSLASIAELEPFFRSSDRPAARDGVPQMEMPTANYKPSPGASALSRDGSGAATAASLPAPAPGPRPSAQISPFAQTSALPSQRQPARESRSDDVTAQRPRLATLRPPMQTGAAPPPQTGTARRAPVPSGPPPQNNSGSSSAALQAPPPLPPPAPWPTTPSYPLPRPPGQALPPGPDRTLRTAPSTQPMPPLRVDEAPYPAPTLPTRRGDPSFEDIETSEPMGFDPRYSIAPQRRRVGGWIVGGILMLGVCFIGYRVALPYLGAGAKANGASALDPRAARFLGDGERAIEDGNLDLAKENFDKASALGEKDPHVLLDVAKLATVRADVPWLKLRLLPDSDEDEVKATKAALSDLVPTLRKAAEDAVAAAPEDTAALRVRVDALRIAGDTNQARASLTKVGTASQPETSYVLAALDLADPAPPWNTVVDRLRIAAAAEGNLGRARAALVYALSRSGDAAGAKSELDRLAALARPHPLVGLLRAFVGRSPAKPAGDAGATASAPSAASSGAVDVNSLPHSEGHGAGGRGESSDPRVLVQEGAEAENRGQFDRANHYYEEVLRIDPRNSEALAGLGTVSLKQKDPATARQYFARALAINPNYVPALVGQADALWQEGDKNGAMRKYKELVDRFPESAGYPSYVKTRAEGSASGPAPASGGGEAPPAKPATPAAPGELTLPSNVPSDLPGAPP